MDGSDFIEKFETLWLFSNVLSSKSQNLSTVFSGETEKTQIDLKKYNEPCSQAKPISIQVKPNIQQTPISKMCVDSALSADSEICTKTVAKTEPIKIQSDSPSRRRKGRRTRCLKDEKRRILREIELGLSDGDCDADADDDENVVFDVNRVYGSWVVVHDEKRRRSEKIVSENHHQVMKMMPALNDGLAMKELLKSWAYAVACSVK